jgi:GH15 family glucan-1,4-alpha-glucosidase
MNEYPLIADHGLIGDLQTSALVSTDGSIDWFCAPRFDSPSIFASLLDAKKGGFCSVRPKVDVFSTKQLYLPDTAVLITRFLTEEGVGEVVDFMPVADDAGVATKRHRIVRIVRCVRGEMTFVIDIAPRFDYGREPHETEVTPDGIVFRGANTSLTVHAVREPKDERLAVGKADKKGDVHVELPLTAGQTRGLVLETGTDGPAHPIRVSSADRLFEDTRDFWTDWISQSTYRGRWREMIDRSAITLKLMTYAPTGGLVAAPTAGLPEQVGGERNWDYRYTWIRDASFSVYSLIGLGFEDEARAFALWLRDRVLDVDPHSDESPLKIMYRIDGSSLGSEDVLKGWEGYKQSSPVRIGNGAADQLQQDIYGEAMDSIYFGIQHGLRAGHLGWTKLVGLLNWVCEHWDEPDEGIWETRGGRQNFTYGRVMNWVALDRGIRLAQQYGRPAPLDRWVEQRDAIYTQVWSKGWSEKRKAFVQHYDTDVLDSSLLRMATVGFISPTDPAWLSTLEAMDAELVSDSLVYRYDPEASPDGLAGSEGTFSLCTFQYVDALARSGQLAKARVIFEKMLTYANHLGLYAEEVGLTGEQLGNFPQAFTHLALIDAAITLDRLLDEKGGRRRVDGD